MRKLVLVMAAALVACGSSNNPSSAVSGTIGGSSFSAAETVGLVVEPKTCSNIPVLGTAQVGAVGVAFSDTSGTCNYLANLSGGQCAGRKNDRTVTIVIARLPYPPGVSQASPTVGPGEYAVGASQDALVPDASAGLATVAFATATKTDASCMPTVAHPTVAEGGQALSTNFIHLTEVSSSKVSGHVDITFDDGGRIQGDFTASVCGTAPDVCALTQATSGLCSGGFTCP